MKRFLVPLDPSPYTEATTAFAARLAAATNGQVSGLAVLDLEGVEEAVGPVPLGAGSYAERLTQTLIGRADNQVDAAQATFLERCDKLGVAATAVEEHGAPHQHVFELSKYHDLLVMGTQTYYRFGMDLAEPGDFLHELLVNEGVTPIVAVPATAHPAAGPAQVLIAFDGSPSSSRALRAFAQIYQARPADFGPIKLVTAAADENDTKQLRERAVGYLRTYGMDDVTTMWTARTIKDWMRHEEGGWADFFVVGTHSKTGLFDFQAGGLPRMLIEQNRRPVLLGM